MKKRAARCLLIAFCGILSVFFLRCDSGTKSGKVYKSLDGRVQKLELYDKGIKIVYNFDAFEMVESALAYKGESLIAKAERVGMRPVEAVTMEIEVAETHFHQKTGEIVYKGKMVFCCRANVEMGERINVTPVFGKRPRDLFREWPYAIIY